MEVTHCAHWIGGFVGSRASLDAMVKKIPFPVPAGKRTLVIHPVP
jgi:hypothetical protein